MWRRGKRSEKIRNTRKERVKKQKRRRRKKNPKAVQRRVTANQVGRLISCFDNSLKGVKIEWIRCSSS